MVGVGDGEGFFGEVASGAQALGVGEVCGAVLGVALDVVGGGDGCVAVGAAAGAVPESDEFGEGFGEESGAGVHGEDFPGGGTGEDSFVFDEDVVVEKFVEVVEASFRGDGSGFGNVGAGSIGVDGHEQPDLEPAGTT